MGAYVESSPIVKLSLLAIDVAAGPIAFSVREAIYHTFVGDAIHSAQGAVAGYVAGELELAGKTGVEAANGGVGGLFLGSVVASGATSAIKGISGFVQGLTARSNLRKNLGITDSGLQAHHLVPYAVAQESEAIRHAMKNGLYDINRKENGIGLPKTVELAEKMGLPQHNGSHANYSDSARDLATKLDRDFASRKLSNEQLMARITAIELQLRQKVASTTGRLN